jgi:hypothetical protein
MAAAGSSAGSAANPLHAVKPSLSQVLKRYGHRRLELEFRLGHRIAGKFVPGVSEAAWTQLKKALDASSRFQVVVTNARELICDDGSGAKYVVPSEGQPFWMHKRRLCDKDVDTGSTWCCRASMSLEEVDKIDARGARPPPTKHKFERHKSRWSYKYRCWSIDITRVLSNLPHQLDNDSVSYEVEIELVDTDELFSRPVDNMLDWGWKIVNDACSFMS